MPDPATTPSQWLAAAPPVEPDETLAAFARSSRAVIDAGESLAADVPVGSPAGRQPWARVLLHALFDALVHERDVTEPLGHPTPASPEHVPVLAYVLLRPQSRLAQPLRPIFDRLPVLSNGMAAVTVCWVIGFAVNDTGAGIPAAGLMLLAPLLLMQRARIAATSRSQVAPQEPR